MTRPDEYSDSELFARLREERPAAEQAFAELYRRHSPRVYAYCLRIMGNVDETKDIFQDTFLRFYQSAQTERDMTNVPAYLLRIARNRCLNVRRDRKLSTPVEDYHVMTEDTQLEHAELEGLVLKALDQLPLEYKDAFVLREYEGLSYAEIADVTGESLANVKVRIFRAKEKMRKILGPVLSEQQK